MPDFTEFQSYLLRNGRKLSTIRTHLNSLKLIFTGVPSGSPQEINNWLLRQYERGLTGKYLNHIIFSLRLWGRFNNTDQYNQLEFFKEKEHIKSTMSDEEIEAFLNLPYELIRHTHYLTGKEYFVRANPNQYDIWTMFFSIMAYTGMRPGEVAHLTVDDVDFGRSVFSLEDTKTNTPRFVPIPPNIRGKIEEFVKDKKTYLFPSSKGGCHDGVVVDDVDWWYNFHKRITRLGIVRKNLTPYSLRHSLITRLLEEDVNLFKVQKIVGHKLIETTAHYTHLTTKDICDTIKKHPLVRKGTSPEEILRSLIDMIHSFGLEKDKRFNYEISESPNKLSMTVSY